MNTPDVYSARILCYCLVLTTMLFCGCQCPYYQGRRIVTGATEEEIITYNGPPEQIVRKADLSGHDLDVWNSATFDEPEAVKCLLYGSGPTIPPGVHYFYLDSEGKLTSHHESSAKSYGPWP